MRQPRLRWAFSDSERHALFHGHSFERPDGMPEGPARSRRAGPSVVVAVSLRYGLADGPPFPISSVLPPTPSLLSLSAGTGVSIGSGASTLAVRMTDFT